MCIVWRGGGNDKSCDDACHFLDFFHCSIKEMGNCKDCFVYWEVWRHRNPIIFEGQNLSLSRVCNRVLEDLGEIE